MEELKLKSEKYLSLDINAKRKLAVKAAELQDLWEEEKRSKKPVYNLKLNRYVRPDPKWGFITRTVNEAFPALQAGGREVSTNLLSLFLL